MYNILIDKLELSYIPYSRQLTSLIPLLRPDLEISVIKHCMPFQQSKRMKTAVIKYYQVVLLM